MLLRKLFLLILCGFYINPLLADSILLKDGSRVQGTLSALHNGVYTIDTSHLGVLKIPQSEIVSINSSESQSANSNSSLLATLQATIAKDPKTLEMISDLKNNPNVNAILNDEEIMQAIAKGDFQTLLGSPKVQKLINDPQMNEITKRIQ